MLATLDGSDPHRHRPVHQLVADAPLLALVVAVRQILVDEATELDLSDRITRSRHSRSMDRAKRAASALQFGP